MQPETTDALTRACDEIIQLRRAQDILRRAIESHASTLEVVTRANDDLNVQCKFWRQAAEHAVNGWNMLEDKYDHAIEILGAVVDEDTKDLSEALWGRIWAVVNEAAELEAAPEIVETVDLGDGVKLRLVDEETPTNT